MDLLLADPVRLPDGIMSVVRVRDLVLAAGNDVSRGLLHRARKDFTRAAEANAQVVALDEVVARNFEVRDGALRA